MSPLRLPRAVLRVSGVGAFEFLDSLLTNSVSELPVHRPAYAALLSPQGKLVSDAFVWARPTGEALLDVPSLAAETLLQRLTLYKLRAPVTLEDVSSSWAVFADLDGAGPDARPDPRLDALPRRVVRNENAGPPPLEEPNAYRARRIAFGVPDPAFDSAPEEVFGLEALLEELQGVDFQKGCFVGQENISRMKRRATTRRKFCPIEFAGPAPVFGSPIHAGPAEIGSVRSSDGSRAIALIRLDRAKEARDTNVPLVADGERLTLAPPAWLLMPEEDESR
jgi:folate-binding protein YgfZ